MRWTLPASLLVLASTTFAQTPSPSPAPAPSPVPAPAARLTSSTYEWAKLVVEAKPNGSRRAVLDGPTATLDRMHVHITTLNPGEKSGEPRKHLQEEVIIVKEGTIEANWDGKSSTIGPGSVIFFASNAVTYLRNAGKTPATYYVVYYYTPLTPKD
jgi:XRE family transcriptional regulator, regulator of sulfur utilization